MRGSNRWLKSNIYLYWSNLINGISTNPGTTLIITLHDGL